MRYFNPRAPYGARRQRPAKKIQHGEFQSTRPIRGATRPKMPIAPPISNFNPRAPYGARHHLYRTLHPCQQFQSTRPIRGATKPGPPTHPSGDISIHAPHTGRDRAKQKQKTREQFQSTRPIRGATAGMMPAGIKIPNFNPRAPYGARLDSGPRIHSVSRISIHAPHTGRD